MTGGTYPFDYAWSTGQTWESTQSIYGNWEINQGCLEYTAFDTPANLIDTICIVSDDGVNSLTTYIITTIFPANHCMGDNTDTDGDGVCDFLDGSGINDPCSPYSIDINNNGICDFQEPNVIDIIHLPVEVSSTASACINLPNTFDLANTNYSFCNSSDGNLISNLSAGNYTVTLTDAGGCSHISTIQINEPTQLTGVITSSNVNCFGDNDGNAMITPFGGTGPYQYIWDDNSTSDVISNLIAGSYTVTITDSNQCTTSVSIEITQPDTEVTASLSQIQISCNNENNSSAEVIASGGTGIYVYNWSSGGTNTIEGNLPVGNVSVTITDSNGCTAVDNISMIEYPPLAMILSGTDATCNDSNNGTASVDLISGGTGNGDLSTYDYNWSGNPQGNNPTALNLYAGTHYVTITDTEGCTTTDSITIFAPPALDAIINTSNQYCNNTADGYITINGTGGTAPYSYQWDENAGSSTQDSIYGLLPGFYNVTVTDDNNCIFTKNIFLSDVAPLGITFLNEHNLCYADSIGSITAVPNGGTPPFSYNWSNDNLLTDSINTNLVAGEYTLTVTDANGCTFIEVTTITEEEELILQTFVEDVTCNGGRDGSIETSITGGTIPFTYSIDDENYISSSFFPGLAPGYYSVSVQDYNNCITVLDSVEVGEPLAVGVDIYPDTSTIVLNLGDSIILTNDYFNTIGDVEILWDAVSDDSTLSCFNCQFPIINTMENDIYQVTVTDENGCSATDEVQIIIDRDRSVFVPSGFTPNGDGMNDVLMVHGQEGTKVLVFRVYDRWGELVFRAYNYDINSLSSQNVWDGTFKGNLMNPAVFVWHLEVEYIDGRTESFEGNSTLIR